MKKKSVDNNEVTNSYLKKAFDKVVEDIAVIFSKTLSFYPTKEDLKDELKKFATKDDLKATEKRLSDKIENIESDISDHRRRIRDLENDTITRTEFAQLKAKVV